MKEPVIFDFPIESRREIEQAFNELVVRYREHGLTPEETDYMDWANNVLDHS